MTGKEHIEAKGHDLAFGEKLFYAHAGPIVGSVLYQKDGYVGGRAALTRIGEDEFVTIGSGHIMTTWNTESGKLVSLTTFPPMKIYPFGLPQLSVSFEDLEPRVSVQHQVDDFEFVKIPDGLLYKGKRESEVIMDNLTVASFSPAQIVAALKVWLDREDKEDAIVIDSGKGRMEWVRFSNPVYRKTFAPIIRLLDSPRSSSLDWRMSVADEVKKLRFQIIENGMY